MAPMLHHEGLAATGVDPFPRALSGGRNCQAMQTSQHSAVGARPTTVHVQFHRPCARGSCQTRSGLMQNICGEACEIRKRIATKQPLQANAAKCRINSSASRLLGRSS